MAAEASGAAEIVAIDRVGHRLTLAAELGATPRSTPPGATWPT